VLEEEIASNIALSKQLRRINGHIVRGGTAEGNKQLKEI